MFHVVTNHVKVSFAHIEGFIDDTTRVKKQQFKNKNVMNILSEIASPLTTMKKVAVCAMLVFACVNANADSKDFDKLSKIKDVNMTHVDKNMINLAAQTGAGLHLGDAININDEDGDMIKTISDIKIFHSEKKKAMDKMKTEATKILKAKKWQPLIDQKGEEGEIVKIYQAKDGDQISNVVVAIEEDDAVVVVIDGTFDLTKLMGMGGNGDDDNNEDKEDHEDEEQK